MSTFAIYNGPISLFSEMVVTDGIDILNEIRKNNLVKENNYFTRTILKTLAFRYCMIIL